MTEADGGSLPSSTDSDGSSSNSGSLVCCDEEAAATFGAASRQHSGSEVPEGVGELPSMPMSMGPSFSLSGASGKLLVTEVAKLKRLDLGLDRNWPLLAARRISDSGLRDALGRISVERAFEKVERGVVVVYDRPLSAVFNFVYDVLHLSSGRDKFCAFLQGFAKFGSASLSRPDSERHFMFRGIEDSLSEGRKIFRLFKEFREVYKVRRGIHRLTEGMSEHGVMSIPAVCGLLDTCGHIASFFYYLFDNLLWAGSVGLIRSKEIPTWQRKMWDGFRRDGPVLRALGGLSEVKRKKNLASIWRLCFGFLANVLLLYRALKLAWKKNNGATFEGPDDPRLFHTFELIGMLANFRILRSKLGYTRLSHEELGLLAMLASAEGIWVNWRKVRRKKCGTKDFVVTLGRSSLSASTPNLYALRELGA